MNREEFCMSEDEIVKYLKEVLEENVVINKVKHIGFAPNVEVRTEDLKGCFRLSHYQNGVFFAEILDEKNCPLQSRFFSEIHCDESVKNYYERQLDSFLVYYKEVREYLDEFLRLQEDISQGYSNSDTFSVKAFFNGAVSTSQLAYSINVWITNPGEVYPEKIGITRIGSKIFLDTTVEPTVDVLSVTPPAVNDILLIYWNLLDKTLVI